MKDKRFTPLQLCLTALASVLVTLAGVALAVWLLVGAGGLTLIQGLTLVNTTFVGAYTEKDAIDGALAGMVEGLDDQWSYYLTAEELAQQETRRANRYCGVGISVRMDDGGLHVMEVTQGGPAQEGGMLAGDVIVAVDGQSLLDMTQAAAIALVMGEPDTQVTFTIDRAGTTTTLTLTRAELESTGVEYGMVGETVGYIRIKNFYDRSAQGLKDGVADLMAQGATSLLFDVRSNPGGYVHELTAMLDYLLPAGPIFASHSKNGPTTQVQSDAAFIDLPMVVLVDADSYSCAELFAAQLRESNQSKVVGQLTSGKGYSQQAMVLANGGAMNISTGAYTTGGGHSLVGTGLIPDVQVEDQQEQMEAALALLNQ